MIEDSLHKSPMKTSNQSNTSVQPAPIHITEQDKASLEKMIDKIKRSGEKRDSLDSLVAELDRATVVDAMQISRNVVTMNSRVSIIDADTSEMLKFTLVFPEDADAEENKISVLSPIGSGMLGYTVGDDFEWAVPAGIRKFTIAKVDHQPEAASRPAKFA